MRSYKGTYITGINSTLLSSSILTKKGVNKMSEIKSSYDIAMEKMKNMGIDESQSLTEEQKNKIAGIRTTYDAKIAEKKILLKDAPELPDEIRFLERERDRKIQELKN
jgi:hypothetical protein